MLKFKKGDSVVCIDPDGFEERGKGILEFGRVYTVDSSSEFDGGGCDYMCIVCLVGINAGIDQERFISLSDYLYNNRVDQISNILK